MEGACTADGAGFACEKCPDGYEGDGVTCEDVDGCSGDPCFAGVTCTDEPAPGTGFTCGACPAGHEGDGLICSDVNGCEGDPCFAGVVCSDVPAPGDGFECGDCPPGLGGDGVTCTEIDGCAGAPCLAGTSCTDVPAPGDGFTCTPCNGQNCPILRALAGPDQQIVLGTTATLMGDAVGYNGAFTCVWTNDQDATSISTCTATVTPVVDTLYTLEVTDASGLTATDQLVVRITDFTADAGPDSNILSSETATLTASWVGASCPDESCISCEWRLSDQTPVASTCTTTVAPTATTQYFVTVTDTAANRSASDSATVFVTDQPAQLCGWNVVVMTSQSYATGANPNYVCDQTGTARQQTVNGKPAIVLSDLVVQNVRISGHISVETTGDDDLIGFIWGWQNPKHFYLVKWKQLNQGLGACGTGLAGLAVTKVDGSTLAPDTVSFNPSFGFNATDYVYSCALSWAGSRADEVRLLDNSIFLHTPDDPGAFTGGWADLTTYRFEFYYAPNQTKIVVYEDDLMSGSTDTQVTELVIPDSSYPSGAFAFFSNSQANVNFGDFTLASLSDFAADAGPDVTIAATETATLTGSADLAVPPYLCEWSDGSMTLMSNDCSVAVSPAADTTYTLMVTDDFGRVSTDSVTVSVAP